MFSLSTVTTTFASTQKKFKKFGKKLRKQRDGEVDSIKDKLKDIAKDEVEKTKSLFENIRNFSTIKKHLKKHHRKQQLSIFTKSPNC